MGVSQHGRLERGDRKAVKRVFFSVVFAIGLSVIALVRTDGFTPAKIQGKLVPGEAAAPSEEILAKLSQRYRYLAKGRQCFVFASEDGKEVLKFLNYNRFYFPHIPFFEDYAERRHSRYKKTVESLALASENLSRETGIEYLHLKRGGSLPVLELLGPGGSCRLIDLNQVAFVLQKRMDMPVFEKLSLLAKERGEEGLRQALAAILSLLQKRCSLGIADDDRDIEINFGFLGDEPLLIDPGRLFFTEELFTSEGVRFEMNEATKKLYKWLSIHYPSSAEWLRREITSESSVWRNEL